jgi:DNA replication protein
MKKRFAGFPPGKPRNFMLPSTFIVDLLPLIDDLSELKVMLFTFYGVQQREGEYRYLRYEDYATHEALMKAMQACDPEREAKDILDEALSRAVVRGALLKAKVRKQAGNEVLYFINAEPGQAAVRQIEAGKWDEQADGVVDILPERPNIYQLYEEYFGGLVAGIVDELKDLDKEYPPEWIEPAFKEARMNGITRLSYAVSILKTWRANGRMGGAHEVAGGNAQNAGKSAPSLLDDILIE